MLLTMGIIDKVCSNKPSSVKKVCPKKRKWQLNWCPIKFFVQPVGLLLVILFSIITLHQ